MLLVVDVVVVADSMNFDVAKMGDWNVKEVLSDNNVEMVDVMVLVVVLDAVKESIVVVDVLEVLDVVEDVVVVVVSHPLQVLAQCVILATALLHNPCALKAWHLLDDSTFFFPLQGLSASSFVVKVVMNIVVEKVAPMVVSHPLHVLSHPPGATRVLHKPVANIARH